MPQLQCAECGRGAYDSQDGTQMRAELDALRRNYEALRAENVSVRTAPRTLVHRRALSKIVRR